MNTIRQILQLTLFFSLLVLMTNIHAAPIRVSVSKNPASIDEAFQILFTAESSPDDEPNFSALERDFIVLNQQHSSRTSLINGKASRSIQWILNVQAKKTGQLIIPAIAFGSDLTDPLTIDISDNNSHAQTNDSLFLDVSVNTETPYVQSQVIYTLRLYHRVDIAQAQLTEPELTDAIVTKLTEDKNFTAQIKGIDYAVTERKYAIFPQKSGKMTIKPLTLNAQVLVSSGSNFNDFFNSTRSKRVTSKEIHLEVKPAANNVTHWLTAEQLHISQEWSSDITQMKIGEPLTRTLTLQAKASTVSALPELHSQVPEGLKTYTDQPILKEQKTEDGLMALRQEKIAIIPNKTGTYNLPEIKISWFNTQTNTLETTSLPAQQLTVLASAANAQTEDSKTPITAPTPSTEQTATKDSSPFNWFWVSVVLLILWLLTLFYALSRSKHSVTPIEPKENLNVKQSIKDLKRACAENNALAAKTAILNWGRLTLGLNNLTAIAQLSEPALCEELARLNQVLYAKTSETWQGQRLFLAFLAQQQTSQRPTQTDSLQPLHRLH